MKKIITALFCSLIGSSALAQWTPATEKRGSDFDAFQQKELNFKLDLNQIRNQLKRAQETGPNAQSVEILIPTLRGKIERFAVYSFPVMAKELADQYELGSYIGVGIDDPSKQIRFSVAPNDFQAMIIKDGHYEFIDPADNTKTLYRVHPKTVNTDGKSFVCSTEETPQMISQIEKMAQKGQNFNNQSGDYSKNSDKKYRTMRLAISATSSYVAFTGGTLATALAQINATMTRVNGVFEKDFALHLNVQNFPDVIFTSAASDPYLVGPGSLNSKVQQILTTYVGTPNYDIGHVFNAAGGNGNAGCIGCVCIAPSGSAPLGKGSAFTQSTSPAGDTFDIDYVAHEMGHQLGANHTYSHVIEGSGVNMEPGSGSTIMGYAGITNANVQMNSDAYFHVASIVQIQSNLINKSCDVETNIANNPPAITPLPTYTIPKSTAFALTATATDPENDPLTYAWEEFDDAGAIVNGNITGGSINASNLGNTTYGASFRSIAPSASPTRYFPKLSSVLNGVLDNANNQWESVSKVARVSRFAVTVRDNNPNATQQQTQSDLQIINVGGNGPFKVNDSYQYGFTNSASPILWDVVSTNVAPYNVANVKIDYTTDSGTTWNVLIASTANDGTENFTYPTALNNQNIMLRISAIGNVFYAVKSVYVTTSATCGTAIGGINITNLSFNAATFSWAPVSGAASYVIRYRKIPETTWQQTTSTTNSLSVSGLIASSSYEVQVASVCGTQSPFSASTIFSTPATAYCPSSANNAQFEYISNVTLSHAGNNVLTNTTGSSNYSDFTANATLQPNLIPGGTYGISVNVVNPDYDAVVAYIDFNKNGTFESSERVLNYPVGTPSAPVTGTFTIPSTAVLDQPLRMRVLLFFAGSGNAGLPLPLNYICGTYNYGETEDYNVIVSSSLNTQETVNANNDIKIYPNPVNDVLNVTKVSDKATYKIYSAAGQLVGNGIISNGMINVSSLIKGAYVITIEDKDKVNFNSKFIKK